jgi:hypothetical protein
MVNDLDSGANRGVVSSLSLWSRITHVMATVHAKSLSKLNSGICFTNVTRKAQFWKREMAFRQDARKK